MTVITLLIELAALLQGTPQETAERTIDVVSEYSPLLGVIVALLLTGISTLSAVIWYLFRLHTKEIAKKDLLITSLNEEIRDLNGFIRTSHLASTQAMQEMIRVMDALTDETKSVSADVKTSIQSFLHELRGHVTTLLNLPDFVKAARSRFYENEGQPEPPPRTGREPDTSGP